MSNKFEKLLDLLVNEEMDQANALFHEIVVEKSREIYENLIAEEDDEEMEEDSDEEDESVEEGFMGQDDQESVYEIGGEGDEMPTQDASDDMLGDVEDDDMGDDDMGGDMDDMGDDMGDDSSAPATKADIQDIKMDIDQDFAEIKAAFQQMIDGTSPDDEMGGEFGDDDMGDDEFGDEEDDMGDEEDDMGDDDMGDDDMGDDEKEKTAEEAFMREYREVVGKPYAGGKVASKSEASGANTKSVGLQNPSRFSDGKVSAGNIAQSATGVDKKPGVGGVLKSGGKFTDGGTHNVDGVKSGIRTVKKVPAGHGAEKKGGSAGPVGSGKGDKAGQTDVKKIPQFLKPAK